MFTRFLRPLLMVVASSFLVIQVASAGAATVPGWQISKVYPVFSQINSVAASSSTNAWVGGFSCANPCGPTSALVAHWNGKTWQNIPVPAQFVNNPQGAAVGAVAATSASNAWAFAEAGDPSTPSVHALHWTGSGWHQTFTFPAWFSVVTAVAPGATDAWAFGVIVSPFAPYAAHYNGKVWERVPLPVNVTSVSALSPHDVWAFGESTATATHGKLAIVHWNGVSWKQTTLPRLAYPSGDSVAPAGITEVSSGNVWAMAQLGHGEGVAPGAVLLHWNGKAWTQVKIPFTLVGPQQITSDGGGGFWIASPELVKNSYVNYLVHLSKGRWSQVAVPHRPGDTTQLSALASVPGTNSVWGAGSDFPSPANPEGISRGIIIKYGA